MEMRCYRKILHISYKDHVTNEEVRAKIQQTVGLDKTSCLPFIRSVQNHLARHSESGKKTRQTEQEVWEDNIREWTGLQFAKSQRAVENRENGGNWLRSHLWCPNDPRG